MKKSMVCARTASKHRCETCPDNGINAGTRATLEPGSQARWYNGAPTEEPLATHGKQHICCICDGFALNETKKKSWECVG